MSETTWGVVLLAAEIAGLVAMSRLVGRRRLWWGWLVVFVCVSLPWLTYSVATARWTFLALSILWACVHLTNAARWKGHGHDDCH